MKPSSTHRRREETIRKAVIAMYQGSIVRQAAEQYRLPNSTVHDAFYAPFKAKPDRRYRCALTDEEEQRIVSLILKCADRGAPLTKNHDAEAVFTVVSRMHITRRLTLPFKDGKPGPKYLRVFLKRHKEQLHFVRPLRQEHDRFRAVNADTFCEHFACLGKLITKEGLDPSRIWNLDESGVTPGRDANGRSQQKRVMRRNGGRDVICTAISYDKRITLMPCISAAGDCGPFLLVLKGSYFPYRTVLIDRKFVVDTVANHLPKSAVVTMTAERGGVDQHNFLESAYHFVVHVRPFTANGRKVLLIYDGYRSHMSLSELKLFADSNIIFYALPAHTSGKTQPLDVVAFASLNRKLNELMFTTTEHFGAGATVFDICSVITKAYDLTFLPSLIRSCFERSGIWPLEPKRLMSVPRPADDTLQELATVEQMEALLKQRREELANTVFGRPVVLLGNGFIDTTKRAVLTTAEAIRTITERVESQREIKRKEELAREQRRKEVVER